MLPLLPLLLLQLVLLPLPLVVLVQWVPNLLLDMLLNQQDHLLLLRVFTPDLQLALALDLTLMVVVIRLDQNHKNLLLLGLLLGLLLLVLDRLLLLD